jgi:CRP-like cAMP-binding protein
MLNTVGGYPGGAAASNMLVRNVLLRTIAPDDFDYIREFLEPIELKKGMVLQDTNRPAEFTYFVESGVVSILARTNLDGALEIATVGKTGLVGIAPILGGGPTMQRACVQVPGSALRIGVQQLMMAMTARPSIRQHLMRYVKSLFARQSQMALCNAKHDTEKKLARWLLLSQDYSDSDVLPVTHDLLGVLLNARRAGVTQTLSRFESEGIVARSRGALRIRNRELLHSRSCLCYKALADTDAWLCEAEGFEHRLHG